MSLTEDQIRSWLRDAAPGDKLVYNTGYSGSLPGDLAEYVYSLTKNNKAHVLHYPTGKSKLVVVKNGSSETKHPIYEYAYTLIKASDWWQRKAPEIQERLAA